MYRFEILKKKISLNYTKSTAKGLFFLGTQERVQNSCGKRAISVRATEVLLYIEKRSYQSPKVEIREVKIF